MNSLNTMLGMTILEDPSLSDHERWDFSACRSPARAARRHKRRHFGISKMVREVRKAHRVVHRIGDTLVMHPDLAAELRIRARFAK